MFEEMDVLDEVRRALHLDDESTEEGESSTPKRKKTKRRATAIPQPLLDQDIALKRIGVEDLLRLDGLCAPDLQREINQIKQQLEIQKVHHPTLAPEQSRILAQVALGARKQLQLGGMWRNVQGGMSCQCCGKSPGYKPYARNGSNGAVKGKPNLDKPLSMRTFWIAQYTLCTECWEQIRPELDKELAGEEIAIQKSVFEREAEYELYGTIECRQCSWEGFRNELREVASARDPERTYRGGCPSCDNKSSSSYLGNLFITLRTKPQALVRIVDGEIVKTTG